MRKLMAMTAAVALAAGVCVMSAGAAQAVTIPGDPCSEIDYTGDNGTTFVFPLSNCFDGGFSIEGGDPTVVMGTGGSAGKPLIWYQSVGRTGDTCPDGWKASWAQWPNDGKGGPTCDKTIVWGTGPGAPGGPVLLITINGVDDYVELDSDGDNYVTGCDVETDFYDPPDHHIFGCSV